MNLIRSALYACAVAGTLAASAAMAQPVPTATADGFRYPEPGNVVADPNAPPQLRMREIPDPRAPPPPPLVTNSPESLENYNLCVERVNRETSTRAEMLNGTSQCMRELDERRRMGR